MMRIRKQDPDAIAEEAVGQRHGDPPPYAVKTRPDMSPEEMARRLSKSAGPRASIPEKTAEAVGERVGDAYADPGSAAARNPPGHFDAVRQVAQIVSHQLGEQPFVMVAASFALGYMTALLLHGRR